MIRTYFSLATVAAGAFLLSSTSPIRADITKQHNVAFTAKGLNPYGQGPAFEINRPPINVSSKPLNFSSKPIIDIPIGPGSLAEFIPGIDLPSFLRLQAGIGVFGSNNLEFGYYATAGRLDVNYPATSDLRFSTTPGAENVQTNRRYTIDGNFLPGVTQRTIPSDFWTTLGPGGPDLWLTERVTGEGGFEVRVGPAPPTISAPYFAVSNPYAQAWLDSYIDVRAGAYAKVTALGGIFEVGKSFTIGGRIDGPRLAEVDPSGFYISGEKVSDASITDPIPFTIPNVGTATLQVPSLALAGKNLNGNTLTGSSVKPVLTLDADLEKMIPGIGNFLKGSVGPFSYTLVNVHGGPQIGLKHDISFAPDPKVRLQFSEPVLVQGRACGDAVCADPADQELRPTFVAEMDLESDTLVWQPMFSNSAKIRVTPTYIMDNEYTNKIGIDWSVQGGIKALELTEPIDIEPLINESITASIAHTDLFSTPPIRLDLPSVVGSYVDIPKFNVPIFGADLGDLRLSNYAIESEDPNGVAVFNFEFSRAVAGGAPRTYTANGVVGRRQQGVWGTEEGQSYYTFKADQPVILTDPVTSEQYDLGRDFCTTGCELESILPAESKNYSPQSDPDLPDYIAPLFTNNVAAVPNTDVSDLPNHPILGRFNGPNVTPISYDSQGVVEVTDHRFRSKTTVIARMGEVTPTADGTYVDLNDSPPAIDRQGQVLFAGVANGFDGQSYIQAIYRDDGVSKTELIRSGDPAPDGDGNVGFGESVSFQANDLGQFVVLSGSSVFRDGPGGLAKIADARDPIPDGNGQAIQWFLNSFNNAGQASLTASIYVDEPGNQRYELGIYRADDIGLTKIVRQGDVAPGVTGPLRFFHGSAINDSGTVAFTATTLSGQSGVYLNDGSGLTPVAVTGDVSSSGRVLTGFAEVDVNSSGDISFAAATQPSDPLPRTAIYKWSGGILNEIAVQGVTQRPTGQAFSPVDAPSLNNAGDVAFREQQGIYLYHGDGLRSLAYNGQPLRDGSGTIDPEGFGAPLLNEGGQVAFDAEVFITAEATFHDVIYVHDGERLVEVARAGQPLAGGVIRNLFVQDLNDRMQVAYRAELVDGREVIARFDPDNYWRGAATGSWEANGEWSLRVDPSAPYNTFIIAENPLVVAGPSMDAAVRSLTLGGEHTAQAELKLQPGVRLTSADGVTVRPNGVLSGTGLIDGDVLNTGGLVSPGSSPGELHVDGDFAQQSIGQLLLEIAGPQAGTQYDVLDVTGSIQLAGDVVLAFLNGYIPAPGTRFELLRFGGDLDITQASFFLADAPVGLQATPFVENGVFGLAVAAVPEPSIFVVVGWALVLIGGRRRSHHATN